MTDGLPSYGQIMLSEFVATFILVLTNVAARVHIEKDMIINLVPGALAMTASLAAVQHMFRETSGGIANPAVILAKILW